MLITNKPDYVDSWDRDKAGESFAITTSNSKSAHFAHVVESVEPRTLERRFSGGHDAAAEKVLSVGQVTSSISGEMHEVTFGPVRPSGVRCCIIHWI